MIRIGEYVVPDYAAEGLIEIRNDQEARDQFKYLSVATEGINNPESRVKMVSKLYEDLMKHGNVDFGPIPVCKGDLTKYKYHKDIVEQIKRLEALIGNDYCKEFDLTQKLYNMIIGSRADFEYGFKFEVELIQFTFNTCVLALHKMIDISIAKYIKGATTQPLTTGSAAPVNYANSKGSYENLLIVQGVAGILKIYDKGEWTEMINSFKRGRNNWLGTIGAVAKSAGLITTGATGVALTTSGAAVAGVVALIGFIIVLRKMVYVFYSSAYKIDESIKRNRQFVEYTLKNSIDQSTSAVVKQQHILNFYDRVHDVIETKIFAENAKAVKELKEQNKARFTIADVSPENYTTANIVEAPVASVQPTPEPESVEVTEDVNSGNASGISFF